MARRRRGIWRPTLLDLVILGGILLAGLFVDQPVFKEQAPWLVSLQLQAHSALTRLSWGAPYPSHVSVIEIDDGAFWSPPLSGVQPTSRAYLADLVAGAVRAGARVVGLDFQLKSPTAVPYDDPVRAADNARLVAAILAASRAHVPVVLSSGFTLEGPRWKREPNICDVRARARLFVARPESNPLLLPLPPAGSAPGCQDLGRDAGVAIGYINLPADRRELPLGFVADEFDSTADQDYFSFALQLAGAYESRVQYDARLAGGAGAAESAAFSPSYQAALDETAQNEFVYAGFMPRDAFQKYVVRAEDLAAASRSAQAWESSPAPAELRGRIVIIGATWHQWGQGRGPLVDEYSSPAGSLPGVYLHANYIEALLSGRFARSLSGFYARAIELLAGYALIVMMHAWKKLGQRLIVWLAGAAGLAALALVLAWRGVYLDFALVSLLLLGHVVAEHYENLRQHARGGGGH